jgi:hypothetical protein
MTTPTYVTRQPINACKALGVMDLQLLYRALGLYRPFHRDRCRVWRDVLAAELAERGVPIR